MDVEWNEIVYWESPENKQSMMWFYSPSHGVVLGENWGAVVNCEDATHWAYCNFPDPPKKIELRVLYA